MLRLPGTELDVSSAIDGFKWDMIQMRYYKKKTYLTFKFIYNVLSSIWFPHECHKIQL